MSVTDWRQTSQGHIVGELRWGAAPGAAFRLELAPDGRLVELQARADAGTSLSARQLRAAPIGAMERAVRREVGGFGDLVSELAGVFRDLADRFGMNEAAGMATDWEQWSRSLDDFRDRPRTGPAGRSDKSYAVLAALYIQFIDGGEARPVRAVASRLGMSEKTVQNHLYKAREKGFLTSRGRGRAGGQLTDKAKEILRGAH